MIINSNNVSTTINDVVVYSSAPKIVKDNTNYVLFKGDVLNVKLILNDEYGFDKKVLQENSYGFGISIYGEFSYYFVELLESLNYNETNKKIILDKTSVFYNFLLEEVVKKNKESYLISLKERYDSSAIVEDKEEILAELFSKIVVNGVSLEDVSEGLSYSVTFNLGSDFDYGILYNKDNESNNLSFQCINLGGTTLENDYLFTKDKFIYIPMTREEYVKNLGPVDIIFDNYFPENMFLLENQPGSCDAVVVKNISNTIIPLYVKFELQQNSIGLIKNPYTESDEAFHQPINALTTDGYIIIDGYYISYLEDDELNRLLKNFTKNTATCGEWIKYSNRNVRKIETMPTAEFMEGTNAQGFAEYTKQILNSLYVEKGDTHRLSVLEKIGRINNFNDNNEIERDLISYNSYNQSVNINTEDVDIIQNHTNIQSSGEKLYRTILNNVPMINMFKGTEMAITAIVRALGIPTEVITKSYNEKYDMYDDSNNHYNDPEWFETDHFSLKLNNIKWDDLKKIAESLRKIIIDNKPVPKVFEDFILQIVGDVEMMIHHHGEIQKYDDEKLADYKKYALKNYLEVCTFSKAKYDESLKRLILPVRIDGMKIFESNGRTDTKNWREIYTSEAEATYHDYGSGGLPHRTTNIMNILDKFFENNIKYSKNFTIAVLNDYTDAIQLIKEINVNEIYRVGNGNYYEFYVNDVSLNTINGHRIAIGFVLNPSNEHSPMAIDLANTDNGYIAKKGE